MHEVQVQDASNEEAPLYGYVLENILSHVPLVDLVAASRVSKAWSCAVSSSLNYFKLKPWLIVHSQSTRAPYSVISYAYDPRSHVWIEISQSSIQFNSILRSSHSDFLCQFSISKFFFTHEPFHLTFHDVEAPRVWRVDPIIARVNDTVIIAAGACEFEDDPQAVEIYDFKNGSWHTCDPLPASFRYSSSSTWLSATAANNKLFVMEKSSGVTHWFDPETQHWSEPLELHPDRRIFYSLIAFSGNFPILIGLTGTVENVEAVKIYKVNIEGNLYCEEETGEMPSDFIEKLKCEMYGISPVSVCAAGDLVYLYNEAAADEVVVAEASDGGGAWRWWSVKNEAMREMSRMVFTCAGVGVDDLRRVKNGGNQSLTVKDAELTTHFSLLSSR